MEQNKVEQIKNKICDHMLGVDLNKLPVYDLVSYINAYKVLECGFPFSFPSCSSTKFNLDHPIASTTV